MRDENASSRAGPLPVDTFVLPIPTLRHVLRLLLDRTTDRCFITVGLRVTPGRRDWLARHVGSVRPGPNSPAFEVRTVDAWGRPLLLPSGDMSSTSGLLLLGTGPSRGRVSVLAPDGGRFVPVDRLVLVGPGMHTIDLRSPSKAHVGPAGAPPGDRVRWSRTIAALGGEDVWRRLIDLNVTIVGAGRTGSVVARSLAGVGVRHVVIVDPDVIEGHNVGESDGMHDRDLGLSKAVVVSRYLNRLGPGGERSVVGVHASIWGRRGIELAKRSDVIVSCVDRDGPRLAAALIAAAHHRVMVDVATGILVDDAEMEGSARVPSRIGADVRVILPGEGCLLCRGGLTDYDGAVAELTESAGFTAPIRPGGGGQERLGSLRSLNLVAAGAALRLLEGLVTGRGHGGWMHLEDDGSGRFDITYPAGGEAPLRDGGTTCAVCLRAGLGDAAI